MISDTERPELLNPLFFEDGSGVAFRVSRKDGNGVDISCNADDLGAMIQFLCGLVRYYSTVFPPNEALEQGAKTEMFSIEADSIGLADHPDPSRSQFLVRLGGFHIGFSVPSRQLSELASDLSRMALTLSAEPPGGRAS